MTAARRQAMDSYVFRAKSLRRSHQRFERDRVEARLRILQDVVLRPGENDELIATSADAAAPGDVLGLERTVNGTRVGISMRVLDSRPVIVEGIVRYQLRLKPLGPCRSFRSVDDTTS